MSRNLLDRAIAWMSPERGLKRATARAATDGIASARMFYEAAAMNRRTEGWRTVSTDANGEFVGQGSRLRDVSRDMCRNNPHAARIKSLIAHNVVGTGIIPSAHGTVERAREQVEELLVQHFDTVACDADGMHDLYGLQNLAMKTIVESGEVIVRYRPRRAEDRLPLPFQLQVLEPDYLDESVNGKLSNGNIAVQGIEIDAIGRRVAYWLFPDHPGNASTYAYPKSNRIPAEFVAHVYRMDRPGQARGISWFAPVVLRLRDSAEFRDAQLMRQKIAACFGAFIKLLNPENTDTFSKDEGAPYPVEQMAPGMIQRLRPGEEITFGGPPKVDGYADYMRATDREIAAGMGISYEALTGDLSGVNFSSGRMGWLEFQRSIDAWREHMLIVQLCHAIGRWTMNAAALETGRRLPVSLGWTAPRREMIDPTREVPAAIMAIRGGLSSRTNENRKLGREAFDLDREIAEDNRRADDAGLVFDSDPRRVSQAGQGQTVPPEED